jgi:hypothetical protein
VALPPISGSPTSGPTASIAPINGSRAAAQRAFFDAALKRNQGVDAPANIAPPSAAQRTTNAVASPATPVRTHQPLIQISDEPPTQPLRPGSMVNILV